MGQIRTAESRLLENNNHRNQHPLDEFIIGLNIRSAPNRPRPCLIKERGMQPLPGQKTKPARLSDGCGAGVNFKAIIVTLFQEAIRVNTFETNGNLGVHGR